MELRRMIGAEWSKLRSTRSSGWTLMALAAVVVVLAGVVAVTGSLQPDDTVLGGSVTAGGTIALLLAGALGGVSIASEFSTGLIASTFTACPRRRTVIAAKAAAVCAAVGPTTLLATAGAVLVGRWLLSGSGHQPGDAVPAVFGIAVATALTGVLGLAVGAIVRQPAATVGTVVGMVLAPLLLGPLAGGLQPWIAGASPSGVLTKLAQSSDATPEAVGTLGAWPSLAVMAVIVSIALALAAVVVDRRDA